MREIGNLVICSYVRKCDKLSKKLIEVKLMLENINYVKVKFSQNIELTSLVN